jgi:RNA polymerase-binding transcription factor
MPKTEKTRKDYKAIEEKLRAEQESLSRQISEIEARYYGDENADQALAADEGEPETVTTDRERDLSLLENARDLLDQVERALRKIEDGTYGRCASCGKSIEAARLKALPHASLCIACKRLEERR